MEIIHPFIANAALSYTCIFYCISIILLLQKVTTQYYFFLFFVLFYVMNCVADGKTMPPYLWYRFCALAISPYR